ncbi:MAG: hypothetical protein HYX47_09175 [Burkholderiales bacterium]|nr:hypothetical protein [Burkholderiales bacterium]
MKKIVASIVLAFSFLPLVHAAETVREEAREAKAEAVKAKRTAGSEVRQAGRKIKGTGRKARQAVITRCADGRHTLKGASGCAAHGGVRDPK